MNMALPVALNGLEPRGIDTPKWGEIVVDLVILIR